MGIIVQRNIILRAIVTDKLKKQLGDELQRSADEIDGTLEQIDAQSRMYLTELQRTDLQRAMTFRRQVEAEKQKQQEMRDSLLERKAELAELENGKEIIRGRLESQVEVNEGDNFTEIMAGVEIVLKDDIVVEIRQGSVTDAGVDDVPVIISPEDA